MLAEATAEKYTLDQLVTEIQLIAYKSTGPSQIASFLHLLSPGLSQNVRPLTDQITYRQVRELLDRSMDAGDRAASTVLLLKYFPVVLASLRNLDANTRVPKPGTKVKPQKPFSFDDFKHLGLDKEDLVQEAARLLFTLLRQFNRRTSVFLGWYLRTYFRARFSTYVRDTMTYMEGNRRKVKIGTLAHGGLPEDIPRSPTPRARRRSRVLPRTWNWELHAHTYCVT